MLSPGGGQAETLIDVSRVTVIVSMLDYYKSSPGVSHVVSRGQSSRNINYFQLEFSTSTIY